MFPFANRCVRRLFASFVLAAVVISIVVSPFAVVPAAAASLPPYPAALPRTMFIGLDNSNNKQQPDLGIGWMTATQIPWAARDQFLDGGVNTTRNWTNWTLPIGSSATSYMVDSANAGYLPVLDYYQMLATMPRSDYKRIVETLPS